MSEKATGVRHVPELLAPAGSPEAFYAALSAGADAIYCALGHDFNARRGAHNFTAETFADACRVAHLAGVRVYVTENVVIRTEEMPRALELVRKAWCLGADALIIQDLGLLAEVRRRWPQIELHVSTQANVHDARGVALCRDHFAVARVTLSRELSVKEISRIAQEGVELEGFGHGALCFCYSGICMMSSLRGNRSANRGMCAQPCRLPYGLIDEKNRPIAAPDRQRVLCPKDFCTIDALSQLAEAGLSSLKIEGRMKAPDYVWSIVSAYRAALDDLREGGRSDASEIARRRRLLYRAFNRGFTDAYLTGSSGDEMMSYERSNNRGELVGSVVSSRDLGTYHRASSRSNGGRNRVRAYRLAEVTVALATDVGKGDLLEIRPPDDPSQFLTSHVSADAAAGERIVLHCARPMPQGSQVRVIRSQAALDAAARAAQRDSAPKRPVHVQVTAHRGQPIRVALSLVDSSLVAVAQGCVVEAARTRPLTQDDLIEHVGRMGHSPFDPVHIEVELDEGCGMAFSAVHKVRKEACDLLEEQLLATYRNRETTTPRAPRAATLVRDLLALRHKKGIGDPRQVETRPVEVCALVATPAAARAAYQAGAQRVYARDESLQEGTWRKDVIPWLDEVCREADHDRIDRCITSGTPVAVGTLSELAYACEQGAQAEIRPCIPLHNESCLVELETMGAQGIWFSPELTLKEIGALAQRSSVPTGLMVLGRLRAMTSEHCVLQATNRCIHDCTHCSLRHRDLALLLSDGERMPVHTDVQGRSRIYASRVLDVTPEIGELLAAGVVRLMADCSLCDVTETATAVRRVAAAVRAVHRGDMPEARLESATAGHLFEPIA